MRPLGAVRLARLRTGVTATLPATCTLNGASVACRLASMAAETVRTYLDRLGAASGWVITLPYGTAVEPGDTITAGGEEYDVLGTNDGESYQTAVRAYCGRTR